MAIETDEEVTLAGRLEELKPVINQVITFGQHLTPQDLRRHKTQLLIAFRTVLSAVSNDKIKEEVVRLMLAIDEVIENRRRNGKTRS